MGTTSLERKNSVPPIRKAIHSYIKYTILSLIWAFYRVDRPPYNVDVNASFCAIPHLGHLVFYYLIVHAMQMYKGLFC